MKSPWVTPAAVVIVGVALGAALVGRPTTPANDVRISSVPSTTPTTTLAPSTAAVPAGLVTTTSALIAVTTAGSTTTLAAPVTTQSATADAATTTTSPQSMRSNVLVLVANAGDRSGIARAQAARLVTLGYPQPRTDNANLRLERTTVYARAGHEDEAVLLLADAGLPADRLLPFPRQPITTLDDMADVILALGFDWQT